MSSSPVDVPQIKYGYVVENANEKDKWNWLNVSSPIFKCPEKVYFIFFISLHNYKNCYRNCGFLPNADSRVNIAFFGAGQISTFISSIQHYEDPG